MSPSPSRMFRRFFRRAAASLAALGGAALGFAVRALLAWMRLFNRRWLGNLYGWFLRTIGPWLPEHRVGRANLAAAFPEKTGDEIETILRGVWDNLGRYVAEFPQIDRLHVQDPARPGKPDIVYSPQTEARFHQLRNDGKPALVFASHLANWEVPARIAAIYGLDTMVLYRRPNIGAAADAVLAIRQDSMGTLVPTSMDAPLKLARALEDGRHVAMLVDQHYVKGVEVTFFGRICRANPLIAKLAREVDCPIHGTRVIRLPDGRFHAEITDEVPPVRDAEGRVDVAGTMQAITSVIEDWIRERPEQWLWLHRRWR